MLGIDHADNLKPLSKEIPGLHALIADLADSSLPDRVAGALTSLPPVAGLVNMAGISVGDTIDRLSDEDWNLSFAAPRQCKPCNAPHTLPRAAHEGLYGKGSIVNRLARRHCRSPQTELCREQGGPDRPHRELRTQPPDRQHSRKPSACPVRPSPA